MLDNYLLLIILLSFIIGISSILAGFGGGILLVPLITLFFDIPLNIIIGSVIISLWVPASIGAFAAWRRHEVDFRLGLLFETPTAIGAYFGATLVNIIPHYVIQLIFSFLAIFLSFNMYRKGKCSHKDLECKESRFWKFWGKIPPVIEFRTNGSKYNVSIPTIIIFGLIIGTLAGMLGVGGGWIKTPLLVIGFSVPPVIATSTALFMIVITSIVGGLTHLSEGNIDFALSIAIMTGLGFGAILGNIIKPKLKSFQITYFVSVVLFLVGIILLFETYHSFI